jgi:hypothetical protein
MPLLTPPNDFMRRLKGYDALLDCRWSDYRSCWLIERMLPEQSTLMGGQGHVDIEDHQSAAARKLILFEVDRNALDDRVFYTLWTTDMRRQGGADGIADEIDKRYFGALKDKRSKFRDFVKHKAKERFRYKNTIRTVPEHAVHSAPPGGMSING